MRQFYLFILFFWGGLAILFSSCKRDTDINDKLLYSRVDSIISVCEDSIYTNIPFVRGKIKHAQCIAKDSMQIYRIATIDAFRCLLSDKYDSSYIRINEVIAFCRRQRQTKDVYSLLSAAHKDLGNYYDRLGFIDSALHYHKKAFEDVLKSNQPQAVPDYCINLADGYFRTGDYANAANYYRDALFLSDSLKVLDKTGFMIYFGLGEVYLGLRDFELADSYYQLAEKELDRRDLNGKFIFCNNRGNFYYFKGDYKNALKWFLRARQLVLARNYRFMINLAELNLSDVYLHLNQIDSARYFADRSFRFFDSINHKTATYYLATIKAGIELKEGNNATAFKIMESHKDTSGIEINMISIREKYLEEYYAGIGNYKEAYQYLQKNIKLNETIQSERIRNRVSELDLRYSQDTTLLRRNLIIREQKSQLRYLHNTKIFWFIICLFTIAGGALTYLYMRKQRDLQRVKHFEQLSVLRMQSIRNRISPHFIFNVLNRQFVSAENSKERDELYELATLIRQSLEITESISITLAKELEFITRYVNLENRKRDSDIQFYIQKSENLNIENVIIPAMIIQIPIENALKHAFINHHGKMEIVVRINSREDGFEITVEDNGNGYHPEDTVTKGTGSGLKFIYQTIKLLNQKNIKKITFNISNKSETQGTKVDIFIPLSYTYTL